MRWVEVALFASLATACGEPDPLPPRDQVVLFIDTDAVLPPPEGAIDPPLSPQPLFDRMTIEVFAPGASEPCGACRRELPIDRETFAKLRASIGVVPGAGGEGYRARVRMFRAEAVRGGGAPVEVTLETTVALPDVAGRGVVEAHVVLMTDDLGVPVGTLEAPAPAREGRPPASLVGSWGPAQRIDCSGAPLDGEVCVPGGAYWMGETEVVGAVYDGDRQRLVVLSPFFIGAKEVTVGEARAGGLTPQAWSGSLDGVASNDWCTFTNTPSARDALAVNCVTWDQAREHCLARGADLPTEAQWEYAARALGGRRYVWGVEPPSCSDAVWGHGYPPAKLVPHCPVPNVIGGPLAPGGGVRDRLTLPGGDILDLAGNVREWTRDVWNTQDEPCWTPSLLFDPVCESAGAIGGEVRSVRGDGYFQPAIVVSAAGRSYEVRNVSSAFNGVRCARPGG